MEKKTCVYCDSLLNEPYIPTELDKNTYCNCDCYRIHRNLSISLKMIIRNLNKIKKEDKEKWIKEPLNEFNKFFNRDVCEKDFIESINEFLGHAFGTDKILFFAYYKASRKVCKNYIPYKKFLKEIKKRKFVMGKETKKILFSNNEEACILQDRTTSLFIKNLRKMEKNKLITEYTKKKMIEVHKELKLDTLLVSCKPPCIADSLCYMYSNYLSLKITMIELQDSGIPMNRIKYNSIKKNLAEKIDNDTYLKLTKKSWNNKKRKRISKSNKNPFINFITYKVHELKRLANFVNEKVGTKVMEIDTPPSVSIHKWLLKLGKPHLIHFTYGDAKTLVRELNKSLGEKLIVIEPTGDLFVDIWEKEIIVRNMHYYTAPKLNTVPVKLKNGRIISIEKGIASLVKKLNDAGFKTFTSCSGMRSDHERKIPRYAWVTIITNDVDEESLDKLSRITTEMNLPVKRMTRERVLHGLEKLFIIHFTAPSGGRIVKWHGFIPEIRYPKEVLKARFDEFEMLIDKYFPD